MTDPFDEVIAKIADPDQARIMRETFDWIHERFPRLERKVAWKQAMFTDHGTFIIGLSVSAKNLMIGPELVAMDRFGDRAEEAGHTRTKQLIRMSWAKPIDRELLADIVQFNIDDKKDVTTFWRP
jgi:uncharacterized protein YdhG (YjbR/CyaY superfamily)